MDTYLHYKVFGTGAKKLIAFHGFGQDHSAFDSLKPVLEVRYTVYSFDLFYHGKSTRENSMLTPEEWEECLDRFFLKEEINRFSILSFSLGGRFALATLQLFIDRIDHAILIAPDGVYKNFWYRFSTSPVANGLFRYLMLHPQKFENWVRTFEKFHLVSKSIARFAERELKNRENCLRVYQSWTYFKSLQVDLNELINQINRNKTSIHLILGERDYIIPIDKVVPKLERIKSMNTIILPLRHHKLISGSNSEIASLLKADKL